MIKKLMKYDLRKMFKLLIYYYIASILIAGIARLTSLGNNMQVFKIISTIFTSFTYSAIATILINMFIQILHNFNSSLYKDESYLTHTLPVKKEKILISKYLSSFIVILSSVLVSILSLFIVFFSKDFVNSFITFLNTSLGGFSLPVWLILTLLALEILVQTCAIISMTFTAIIKCNTYNSKRVLKGVLWFLCYYFGTTILTLGVAVIFFAIKGNLNLLFAEQLSQSMLFTILIIALICYIIYSIVFYLLSQKLFKKGVNVD